MNTWTSLSQRFSLLYPPCLNKFARQRPLLVDARTRNITVLFSSEVPEQAFLMATLRLFQGPLRSNKVFFSFIRMQICATLM